MKIEQLKLSKSIISPNDLTLISHLDPHLITVFGSVNYFSDLALGKHLKTIFPTAHIIGCSTPGDLSTEGLFYPSLTITGVHFKKPTLKSFHVPLHCKGNSEFAGQKLALNLRAPDLNGILVLAQGAEINGTTMIAGLKNKLANGVIITGGLAGEEGTSEKNYVLSNEVVSSEIIAGLGIYGKSLKLDFSLMSGWQPFVEQLKFKQFSEAA